MDLQQLNEWMAQHDLRGYWESVRGGDGGPGPKASYGPYLWRWADISHALQQASELIGPEDSFRRFVGYVHPEVKSGSPAHLISAGLQLVKPGERPAAHRHSMAAIRFVTRGGGAVTIVNGEEFPMEAGDLITTPSKTWHEHNNRGSEPIIWVDALDAPLVMFLQARSGDPYPGGFQQVVRPTGMSAAESGVIRPSWMGGDSPQPPPYRYPWEETRKVLEMLAEEPGDPFDGVLVRYLNPRTGGPTMPTISCEMQMVRPGERTQAHRHTSSTLYHAFRGRGRTVIEGQPFEWEAGDSFVVPLWCPHQHENPYDEAGYLFVLSDRPVIEALGLYEEQAV